jgi:hypothetical protein
MHDVLQQPQAAEASEYRAGSYRNTPRRHAVPAYLALNPPMRNGKWKMETPSVPFPMAQESAANFPTLRDRSESSVRPEPPISSGHLQPHPLLHLGPRCGRNPWREARRIWFHGAEREQSQPGGPPLRPELWRTQTDRPGRCIYGTRAQLSSLLFARGTLGTVLSHVMRSVRCSHGLSALGARPPAPAGAL